MTLVPLVSHSLSVQVMAEEDLLLFVYCNELSEAWGGSWVTGLAELTLMLTFSFRGYDYFLSFVVGQSPADHIKGDILCSYSVS